MRGQIEPSRVAYAPQIQPLGGCGGGAPRAIARLEDLCRPERCGLALSHGDQKARDVAHHVVQEGIGRCLDREPVAAARDAEPLHAAHRRFRLAFRGPECREVVPPDERTPAALAAYYKAETEKWWPIIKAAGIKAD